MLDDDDRSLHKNCDISKWNVSSVTEMKSMFAETMLLKGDISSWDVLQVTGITYQLPSAERD